MSAYTIMTPSQISCRPAVFRSLQSAPYKPVWGPTSAFLSIFASESSCSPVQDVTNAHNGPVCSKHHTKVPTQ